MYYIKTEIIKTTSRRLARYFQELHFFQPRAQTLPGIFWCLWCFLVQECGGSLLPLLNYISWAEMSVFLGVQIRPAIPTVFNSQQLQARIFYFFYSQIRAYVEK